MSWGIQLLGLPIVVQNYKSGIFKDSNIQKSNIFKFLGFFHEVTLF